MRDTKTKEINVKDCLKAKDVKEEVSLFITPAEESEKIKTIKEAIPTPTIKISFKEDNNMLLLVLSTLIFSIFFVFIVIVLYARY